MQDKKHRPTSIQWNQVLELSEIMVEDFPYSQMELIDFETYLIHLKSGERIGFDCISYYDFLNIIGEHIEEHNIVPKSYLSTIA